MVASALPLTGSFSSIERDVAVMDAAADGAVLPIEVLDGSDDGKLLVDVQGPRSEGKARHGMPPGDPGAPAAARAPKAAKKSPGPRAVASGLRKAFAAEVATSYGPVSPSWHLSCSQAGAMDFKLPS